MDPVEHKEIRDFLCQKLYPEHCSHSKNCKRNFRSKAMKFRVNEENTLYQVSYQSLFTSKETFG